MLIDWFTVIAQVINFLILVWLLKRFLYKPILLAIDTREKDIADQISRAATKKAEADKELDDFQHKAADFDQQRTALLGKAVDEANAERQRLLGEARKEYDSLRTQQQETLNRESENISRERVKRTYQEVFAIARKTLSDLAGASLEERMADVFVHRLNDLNAEDKAHLADALKSSTGTIVVRSTFDLPPAQQSAVQDAAKEVVGGEFQVRFETSPDLMNGIELTAQGYKLSWSIADYLATLEQSYANTLKVQYAD